MTTNVESSLDFYTRLFPEWSIQEMKTDHGMLYRVIRVAETNIGGIVPLDPGTGVPPHWIGSVAVEDCKATVVRMEQHGAAVAVAPLDVPSVGRYALVCDPQGAAIKPFQPEQPMQLPEKAAQGQFCWDELHASNLDEAETFYHDTFGWDVNRLDMGTAGLYTMFKIDGKDVAGAMVLPPEAETPPNWMAYVAVDDVLARAAQATKLGAMTYVAPRDIPGQGRFSVHGDPSGAAFALFEPIES
jgi:hypothetical protein